MNSKQLKAQRIQLFRDAANFKHVDRVPHLASAVTWKIFDAGHTLDEAFTDFNVMENCVKHFLDNYYVDALLDIGIRNQFNITEAFGSGSYYYYTEEAVGIKDHSFCTIDTLDEYLDNPEKYLWEKLLPEKYGDDWAKKDYSVWKKAYRELISYTVFLLKMNSMIGKYGIPSIAPNNPISGAIQFGIEELEANILGIKQLSIAMRRSPDKIADFITRWDAEHIDPLIEKVRKSDGPNYKYCFDASVMMLAHNIISPKQFEAYYWPSLEKLLDAYAEKKYNVRIFCEGSIERYLPYFEKYDKGLLTLHIEQDNLFDVREKLPNAALMGGITTDILSGASPDECVAYVKLLCDELGKGGGFIFSENKMLSYKNDAKSENLKAVCDFLRDYRFEEEDK